MEAFKRIKDYLVKPPVVRAPRVGETFRLYIAATHKVIGVVLTQDSSSKEAVVAYLSKRMVDAETRYTHVEKLCLSLYYACSKFRPYILSSSCVVTCKFDILKHMIQKPILSGRMGKWAYSLVEYDLTYELLTAVRGQVVANFIVDHSEDAREACYVEAQPWKLFFDGSVCSRGCGIDYVTVSPVGVKYEMVVHLEYKCTNNRAEYEALAAGLEMLLNMKAKNVEAYGDSQLVVQQILGESHCLDRTLKQCLERCMRLIEKLDTFHIRHIRKEENEAANRLAQQASGYEVTRGKLAVQKWPTSHNVFDIQACTGGLAGKKEEESETRDWRVLIQECIMNSGAPRIGRYNDKHSNTPSWTSSCIDE
jgi:ribonuclease HI